MRLTNQEVDERVFLAMTQQVPRLRHSHLNKVFDANTLIGQP